MVTIIAVIAVIVVALILYAIRILREYERGVVFQLGRFWSVKGPGLIILIPIIQQMVRIDLRTFVLDVPEQDIITYDNVSVRVNAVIYYRVVDPQNAVMEVEEYTFATSQLAQTTLRSVIGQHQLDELLSERDKLNADIQEILDKHTDAWGIKVANVELKHVDLDQTMIRAMAKQAEAERLRRAKVISAEGEYQASAKIAEASQVLAVRPEAMQIRYLSALQDVAGERTSTILLPMPMDWLSRLGNIPGSVRGGGSGPAGGPSQSEV